MPESPYGYGIPDPPKKAPVRVVLSGPPIRRQYPGSKEDTSIIVDLPAAPALGDRIRLDFDDLPPLTITSREWVYESDIKKWHLSCNVE